MGDENLIRTLADYSKLSHEGYRNTIELPVGNNVDCKTPQRYPDVPTTSWRISIRSMDSGPHDTQYCMEDPEQAFVEYASARTNETASRPFTMNQGPRSFNEAIDALKERPSFNWVHAQTFVNPQNGSLSTYSSNYQTKLEKALVDFDSHKEKRLSSLRTQLVQQQNDMISKLNLLWKTVSENLDDTPLCDTARSPTT
ncbi:hypothetical protein Tco_0758686 [Tanacetum coccineum]